MTKRITNVALGFLIGTLIIIGMQLWHPWQRQPVVFYEPSLILPIETIEGDIITFNDGTGITIDRNKRINAIEHSEGQVTINSTIRVNLWELLTR